MTNGINKPLKAQNYFLIYINIDNSDNTSNSGNNIVIVAIIYIYIYYCILYSYWNNHGDTCTIIIV